MSVAVGDLLRDWRGRRRLSQLDLAIEAGVSTRHLSCVETGRSRPSPELLISLAEHLDVPLRERNALLLAAGYAPRYRETSIDDPSMAPIRASIQRMLDAHDPYPALVVDRHWDLVLANSATFGIVSSLPADLVTPPVNVYRAALHPDGLVARSANANEWVAAWLDTLRRQALITGDAGVQQLYDEVAMYPDSVAALDDRAGATPERPVVTSIQLDTAAGELTMFTTLTTFGTALDITLDELAVELFWPADESSAAVLRALAG
jgi:transcriptional regulator with XRE-family HTH domain